MKSMLSIALAGLLFISACTNETSDTPADGQDGGDVAAAPAPNTGNLAAGDDADATPVAIQNGTVALSPRNTNIQFVGTHTGDNPDPRTGGFERFSGTIRLDGDSQKIVSIAVDIETDSLFTPITRLTNHLKSGDFFDTREFPTAKFESTSVVADASGREYDVTGNLTLHGVTKPIRFPAIVDISDEGLTLHSEFIIERSEFGMTYGPDRVENEVAMTVTVGRPTNAQVAQGGGGGRGGFDPGQIFSRRDANGDGKLAGDEISGRMRENLEAIDTDSDGVLTLEEFQNGMSRSRGRRGAGEATVSIHNRELRTARRQP